jgi:hypothetical protein
VQASDKGLRVEIAQRVRFDDPGRLVDVIVHLVGVGPNLIFHSGLTHIENVPDCVHDHKAHVDRHGLALRVLPVVMDTVRPGHVRRVDIEHGFEIRDRPVSRPVEGHRHPLVMLRTIPRAGGAIRIVDFVIETERYLCKPERRCHFETLNKFS